MSFLTQLGPAVGGVPSCSPICFANYKYSNIVINIVTEIFSYFVFFPEYKFLVMRFQGMS